MTGASRFRTSSAGLRAEELSEAQRYRILALGGSTTECLYLDQHETWTHLLQERLTASAGVPVWVGNAAMSGRSSVHHVLQSEKLLPQYPRIDAILLLTGVNDLLKRLGAGDRYDPVRPTDELFHWAFFQQPYGPIGGRTAIGRLYARRVALRRFRREPLFQDDEGRVYAKWRRHRREAQAIRTELPDLTTALDAYTRNLNAIIDFAQSRGTKVILATQPSMWRADLSLEERDLTWMGGIGNYRHGKDREYYTVEALAAGLARFNGQLLEVCHARKAICVDLDGQIPRDTSIFYDDVHFNEGGARAVADVLVDAIAPSVVAAIRQDR